jgi:hypothetical protein
MDVERGWNCEQCTFLNHGAVRVCEMCESARPAADPGPGVPAAVQRPPTAQRSRKRARLDEVPASENAGSFPQSEAVTMPAEPPADRQMWLAIALRCSVVDLLALRETNRFLRDLMPRHHNELWFALFRASCALHPQVHECDPDFEVPWSDTDADSDGASAEGKDWGVDGSDGDERELVQDALHEYGDEVHSKQDQQIKARIAQKTRSTHTLHNVEITRFLPCRGPQQTR